MEESSPRSDDATRRSTAESLAAHIDQNVEAVVALQRREWESTSPSQRRLERISRFVGRPLYLVGLLAGVLLWVGYNALAESFHAVPFDPPPFQWLDTLITLIALLTTTVVLIAQNRQVKLEQQRSHLDLQVNILTEQKVTKVIHLLEELRRDLPFVVNRHDAQAALLQESPDSAQMISALHEGGATRDTRDPGS